MTSISNIGEGRQLQNCVTCYGKFIFQSRVEKSKSGMECLKVDGIPLATKVASILSARS